MAKLLFETKDFGYEEYELLHDVTSIGREVHNSIALNDVSISRDHCIIQRKGRHYYIRDMNSTNGTHVNNKRITAPTEIHTGDKIQTGRCLMVLKKDKEEEVKGCDTIIGEVGADMQEKKMGYSTFMAKISKEAIAAEVQRGKRSGAKKGEEAGFLKKLFGKKDRGETKEVPFVPAYPKEDIPREKVISEQTPKDNEKIVSVSRPIKEIVVCEIITYRKEKYYVLSIDRNNKNGLYEYHLKKC